MQQQQKPPPYTIAKLMEKKMTVDRIRKNYKQNNNEPAPAPTTYKHAGAVDLPKIHCHNKTLISSTNSSTILTI